MPIEPPPPEVLALLVADSVHRDDLTGKIFILGTRARIDAATFPWNHPNLAVYAALTEGRGETGIQVRLIDVDEECEPVFAHETLVNFSNPTDELEVAFLLTDLVFPEPGDYRLQILVAGQVLSERRFLVIPLEYPEQD